MSIPGDTPQNTPQNTAQNINAPANQSQTEQRLPAPQTKSLTRYLADRRASIDGDTPNSPEESAGDTQTSRFTNPFASRLAQNGLPQFLVLKDHTPAHGMLAEALPYLDGVGVQLPLSDGRTERRTVLLRNDWPGVMPKDGMVELVSEDGWTSEEISLAELRAANPQLALLGQSVLFGADPDRYEIIGLDPATGDVTLRRIWLDHNGDRQVLTAAVEQVLAANPRLRPLVEGADLDAATRAAERVAAPLANGSRPDHATLLASGFAAHQGQYVKNGAILSNDGVFFASLAQAQAGDPIVALTSGSGVIGGYSAKQISAARLKDAPALVAERQLEKLGFVEKQPGVWMGARDATLYMAIIDAGRIVAIGKELTARANQGPLRAEGQAGFVVEADLFGAHGQRIGEIAYDEKGEVRALVYHGLPAAADIGYVPPPTRQIAPGVSEWAEQNPSSEAIRAITHINGLPIEQIEADMQPYVTYSKGGVTSSDAGFLAKGDRLLDVWARQNDAVTAAGRTHSELASLLDRVKSIGFESGGAQVNIMIGDRLAFTVRRGSSNTFALESPFRDAFGIENTFVDKLARDPETGEWLHVGSYTIPDLGPSLVAKGFYETGPRSLGPETLLTFFSELLGDGGPGQGPEGGRRPSSPNGEGPSSSSSVQGITSQSNPPNIQASADPALARIISRHQDDGFTATGPPTITSLSTAGQMIWRANTPDIRMAANSPQEDAQDKAQESDSPANENSAEQSKVGIVLGRALGEGRNKIVREITGDATRVLALPLRPGSEAVAQLEQEAARLDEARQAGLPVMQHFGIAQMTDADGAAVTGLLLERFDGVSSQDIWGLPPAERQTIFTERSLADLQLLRSVLKSQRIRLDDMQWMVRRSDGAIVLNDPGGLSRVSQVNDYDPNIHDLDDAIRSVARELMRIAQAQAAEQGQGTRRPEQARAGAASAPAIITMFESWDAASKRRPPKGVTPPPGDNARVDAQQIDQGTAKAILPLAGRSDRVFAAAFPDPTGDNPDATPAELLAELAMEEAYLAQAQALGLPTVKSYGIAWRSFSGETQTPVAERTSETGQYGLILDRIDGISSNNADEMSDAALAAAINTRTVDELKAIRDRLASANISNTDLEFMVEADTGRVVLIDPGAFYRTQPGEPNLSVSMLERRIARAERVLAAKARFNDARKLREAVIEAYAGLTENPVTPSVRNEQFLVDTLLQEQEAGRDVAVLLADSNNFSTYNTITSQQQGDVAIDLTSQVVNRIAQRLNRIYADDGYRFVGIRKAGDEMALVGMIEPTVADARAHIPDSVARDMVRIYNEEMVAFNEANAMPIPTGTASATVLHPNEYSNERQLGVLLDDLDHAGVDLFNKGQIVDGDVVGGGSRWMKNAGVVILSDGTVEILPGHTYRLDPERHELADFRARQGGLVDPDAAYAAREPNVAFVAEGTDPFTGEAYSDEYLRPRMEAGQPIQPNMPAALPPDVAIAAMAGLDQDAIAALADPDSSVWQDPEASERLQGQLALAINDMRRGTPLESVMRRLAADGINAYSQPVAVGLEHSGEGYGRIDSMIRKAREVNGTVRLEYFEPRGLKEVNDTGYIVVDGKKVAVAHSGGNLVVEQMVRAAHLALVEQLGPDYEEQGLALISRDRGKRFSIAYGAAVPLAIRDKIASRREALYNAMPALIMTESGKSYPIMMGQGENAHAFVFSMAYAAVDADAADPDLTAQKLRAELVTPMRPEANNKASILDLAKELADGSVNTPVAFLPHNSDQRRYKLTTLRGDYEGVVADRRQFDPPKDQGAIQKVPVYRLGRGPQTQEAGERSVTPSTAPQWTRPADWRDAEALLADPESGQLVELHRNITGLIEELATSEDRFTQRIAQFALDRKVTVRLVDGQSRGYDAAYSRSANTLFVDVSFADAAHSNARAAEYRAVLRGVLAEELQHVWHANRGRDGRGLLSVNPASSEFVPAGADDYAGKRAAFVAAAVESGLIDEVYAHHQNLRNRPTPDANEAMGRLNQIIGGYGYGRIPRQALLDAMKLLADDPDFAYRAFLSEQAGLDFDAVHGKKPETTGGTDTELASFDYTIIDSDGQPFHLTLPYDVVAVHEATKTAAFERASSLDRYFFGVSGKAFGTLREAIFAQAVATAEKGEVPRALPNKFNVNDLRDNSLDRINFPIHDLHPLFGDPNSPVGERMLFAMFGYKLEDNDVSALGINTAGFDFVEK